MRSSHLETHDNQREEEQKNPLLFAPSVSIQPVKNAAALDISLTEPNPEKNKVASEALGVALTYQHDIGDLASLVTTSKNMYSLFQPCLIAAKVYYAAPLKEIEESLRNAFKKDPTIFSKIFNLGMVSGTLSQLAVINLDHSIRNDEGAIVDLGMVEKILELNYELSPDTYEKALEQTKFAAPVEEEKAKEAREAANLTAVNEVFHAISHQGDHATQVVADFKAWVKKQKPQVMRDNRYHLNLLHLIYCAFQVFADHGDDLEGGMFGTLGDQFCFKVIGDALESELPPRLQQVLRSSLYDLLSFNKAAPRNIDLNSAIFKTQLAVDSYYDCMGIVERRCRGGMAEGLTILIDPPIWTFQSLLEQLDQPLRKIQGVEGCLTKKP